VTLRADLAALPLLAVAARLGLAVGADDCACPACGAVHRSGSSGRLAVGVTVRGWHCARCKARGTDAVSLVLAAVGHVEGPAPAAMMAAAEARWRDAGGAVAAREVVVPMPRAKDRPDPVAVARLWAVCVPAVQSPAAMAWAKVRGLDLSAVPDGVMRAMPDPADLTDAEDAAASCEASSVRPEWARFGSQGGGLPWARDGYGLLGACYGVGGELVGLRARWVGEREAPKGAKEVSASGVASGGMVYATTGGRGVLSGERRRVWVCEGLPDLAACVEAAATARARGWGMWGVWSGALSGEVCGALAGCEVWVATDDDEAGWDYAARVAAVTGSIRRVVVPGGRDWAAARKRLGRALAWDRMVSAGVVMAYEDVKRVADGLRRAKADEQRRKA
jgi:hypothetical protein